MCRAFHQVFRASLRVLECGGWPPLSLSAICAFAFVLTFGCATKPFANKSLSRYEFERPEMGIPFRILLYASSGTVATNAAEAAFARVAQLNDILSDYEYDSELSKLGRTSGTGTKVKVSDDLWNILKRSQEIAKASNGDFDVTIGPLIQVWRKARREKKLPSAEAIEKARARVGYTNMVLADHTVELKRPDMRLDVGGIAKGYAADEALKVLRQYGITRALAAASGDIAMGDAPPDVAGWKVQLLEAQDTRGQAFLILKNCGCSTSGDLFQFVEIDGKRYSHIVDPHTGFGLTDRCLVTVVAPNAFTSDSLETTICLMPRGTGLKLARRYNSEAREIRQMGSSDRFETSTSGFWKHAVWEK
jgi:thiamine biosynthesis lipoprotein